MNKRRCSQRKKWPLSSLWQYWINSSSLWRLRFLNYIKKKRINIYKTHTYTGAGGRLRGEGGDWTPQFCGLLFNAEDEAVKGEPFASSISNCISTTVCNRRCKWALFSSKSSLWERRRCPVVALTALCWKCQRACANRHGRNTPSKKTFDLRHKRYSGSPRRPPKPKQYKHLQEFSTHHGEARQQSRGAAGRFQLGSAQVEFSPWQSLHGVLAQTHPAARADVPLVRFLECGGKKTSCSVSNPSGFAGCWGWITIMNVNGRGK